MENASPLFCDYETGTCELPGSPITATTMAHKKKQKPLQVIYFTDPICSSCWGIEPQLRKLKLEYGEYINIDYHMGGLLPSWQGFNSGGIVKPSDVAHHWDEASRYYQMPIDGNVWLEDPLDSSYPPSIAFIAAKMQSNTKAEEFLRRIKEMVFMEKKNIAKWQHLQQSALEMGLDIEQFKKDFEESANELFYADLDLAKSLGVRGFPTLFFVNEAGEQQAIYGVKPYGYFEQIILELHPGAEKTMACNYNSPQDIFLHYPTLTTKEFAVITNRTLQASQEFLQGLADDNMVEKFSGRNGEIWKIRTTA